MTGRDDILSAILTAGGLLGMAQMTMSDQVSLQLIAEVHAMADGLQGYDPIAAKVIRERANAVLHGETVIDTTATDIITPPTRELESGE